MSYSENFPSQRCSLLMDFANGGRIDPRATFSRASTANVWDGSKHLSSQNLITNSEDFSAWTANNTTPTANAVAAPDGTTTATTITGNSGTSSKYVLSNSISAAPYPVISVYVKAGTHNYIQIHNDQSSTHYANFDVTSGAGVAGIVGSNTTSTIQAVGSTGWYRCICRINTASMTSGIKVRLVDSASAAYGASSATTGTVHLWGAMATDIGDLTNIVAYQASTGQIHREYAPSLVSKSNNVGRFDYSTDGQSIAKGILIEGQSTNLLPNGATGYNSSNVFSWVTSNGNQAQNAAIAPTGQLEATHFYEDTTTAQQQRIDVAVTTAAAVHTFSGYFKSAGRDIVLVRVQNGGTFYGAQYTFSTETAVNYGTAFSSLSITSVGNGWYRFTATTPTLTAGSTTIYINLSGGALNYDGDGYSGVLFYGLQFEEGAASSVIATSGGAATRAAESLSMTDSSLFDTGSGAITCELGSVDGKVYPTAFALTDSSSQNIVRCQGNNGATQMSLVVNADNSGVATITQSFTSTGTKLAVSYDTNSFKFCTDGGTVDSDTAGQVPEGLNRLEIGGDTYTSSSLNGHVKRIAVYSEALTDTNLQALTS